MIYSKHVCIRLWRISFDEKYHLELWEQRCFGVIRYMQTPYLAICAWNLKKNQLWTGKHIQLVWTWFFSSLKQTRQFKLENGKNQVQTYRGTDYGRTVTKCRLRGLPRYSKLLVLASRLFFSKQALLYLGVPSPWKSNAEIFFGQSKSFPLALCNEWLVDLNCALVSRQ